MRRAHWRSRCAEEAADPQHQPPDRVLGSTRRQHVSDHREHREREHEADVPERVVAGAGRADRGVEEREQEPDHEADQREPGQDPCEKEVTAARRIRELSMFLQHGGMFAGREVPSQGGRPVLPPAYTPPLRGCQHASRLTSMGVRSTIRRHSGLPDDSIRREGEPHLAYLAIRAVPPSGFVGHNSPLVPPRLY